MFTLISVGAGLLVTTYVIMFHQLLQLTEHEEEVAYTTSPAQESAEK